MFLAHQAIRTGQSECVLALGFEKMFTGSLKGFFSDRTAPLSNFFQKTEELNGKMKGPFAPVMFANAGLEHMRKYGTKLEHFAKIAEKNHRHSVNNPYS